MNTSIKVNPTIVDDIEFYVSNDGSYTGMSQSSLAKLCGVNRNAIQTLLDKLGGDARKLASATLKVLPSKDSWVPTESDNNADVIPSDVCAGVIEYYAFESKAANNTAKYSFRKFAKHGIDTWIKEVTGYKNQSEKINVTDSFVVEALQRIMTDITELKEKTKAYDTLKGRTVTVFPNLNRMLDTMEVEDEFDELEPDVKEMTATEWLAKNGVTLDATKKRQFALLLSETYKTTTGKEPKKVRRKSATSGKYNNGVSVYHFSEYPILQLCLNKLLVKELN